MKYVLIGGGGHSRVLIDLLKCLKVEINGIVDPQIEVGTRISGVEVIGDDSTVFSMSPESTLLVNGIGSVKSCNARKGVFEKFTDHGYRFASLVHPRAIVADEVELNDGVQVMAGVVIQTGCLIGRNVILNTGCILDHDCQIGDHSHIAPGVTLSGGVRIGNESHTGTGASIVQYRHIGNGTTIGAGSVVVRNIGDGIMAYGVPAKEKHPLCRFE